MEKQFSNEYLKKVDLYTDGSCVPNPGQGGWGFTIIETRENSDNMDDVKQRELEVFSYGLRADESVTTNNKMELTAVIKGLTKIKEKYPSYLLSNIKFTCVTDSQYVKNGITSWIINWRKNGFKTVKKKPVKNQILWKSLDLIVRTFPTKIEWKWVNSHTGNKWNERADQIANQARDEKKYEFNIVEQFKY